MPPQRREVALFVDDGAKAPDRQDHADALAIQDVAARSDQQVAPFQLRHADGSAVSVGHRVRGLIEVRQGDAKAWVLEEGVPAARLYDLGPAARLVKHREVAD